MAQNGQQENTQQATIDQYVFDLLVGRVMLVAGANLGTFTDGELQVETNRLLRGLGNGEILFGLEERQEEKQSFLGWISSFFFGKHCTEYMQLQNKKVTFFSSFELSC